MMSQPTPPFEAESAQATPPPIDYSQPLITTNTSNNEEDEAEWEYEYSTTETEVFYTQISLPSKC
jgi:hypothetical protein